MRAFYHAYEKVQQAVAQGEGARSTLPPRKEKDLSGFTIILIFLDKSGLEIDRQAMNVASLHCNRESTFEDCGEHLDHPHNSWGKLLRT